jgi:hypothetical protein
MGDDGPIDVLTDAAVGAGVRVFAVGGREAGADAVFAPMGEPAKQISIASATIPRFLLINLPDSPKSRAGSPYYGCSGGGSSATDAYLNGLDSSCRGRLSAAESAASENAVTS